MRYGIRAMVLASPAFDIRLYVPAALPLLRAFDKLCPSATRGQIVELVMRETAGLTAAGVVIGLAAGLALSQLIRSMLFGLAPHDPATFAGAALVLIAVAAVAGYLPALRASRVDPMAALRLE